MEKKTRTRETEMNILLEGLIFSLLTAKNSWNSWKFLKYLKKLLKKLKLRYHHCIHSFCIHFLGDMLRVFVRSRLNRFISYWAFEKLFLTLVKINHQWYYKNFSIHTWTIYSFAYIFWNKTKLSFFSRVEGKTQKLIVKSVSMLFPAFMSRFLFNIIIMAIYLKCDTFDQIY
jgi:hypothetical protein